MAFGKKFDKNKLKLGAVEMRQTCGGGERNVAEFGIGGVDNIGGDLDRRL